MSNPSIIPAALILVAFIGLCLVALLRWMSYEMNRKP
jgi:hypothetical protein